MAKIKEKNLTKEERIEFLKKKPNKPQNKSGLIIGILFAVGLVFAFWGLYVLSGNVQNSTKPKENSLGDFVAASAPPNDRLHVNPGQPHVAYTSNPPSSGPHYNAPGLGPIACQVYDKPVVDESVVHNLEHGAVWISYKDENNAKLAKELDDLANRFTKVVVSPRPTDDSPIAAVAWERVFKLQSYDQQKLEDFIKLYRDSTNAPERFAPCG